MFIVRRTYTEEEEEEGRVSRGWRSIGIRAWRERGGTQWVRQEGYHIFTGISSFKMFIRRSLTLYLFSATRSLHSRLWSLAVWSDMLPVIYMSVCVWSSVNEACVSKCTCMLPPDYPLTLLITRLCHSSRFCQPTRTNLAPLLCHLFL